MTVDLYIAYMLKLDSMTLTLKQGYSGSAKAKIQCWVISTTKQATRIKLTTTVGLFFSVTLPLQTFIWLDQLVFLSVRPSLPSHPTHLSRNSCLLFRPFSIVLTVSSLSQLDFVH